MEKSMKKMVPLSELMLMDRFLFAEAMEDDEIYRIMLQILLGKEVPILSRTETEKEVRTTPWLRSIRMDVYATDEEGVVYNSEMQKQKKQDLPKRSRYYQSLMDSTLLEPGVIKFNLLNDSYLIMITPYDVFGDGKYRYTFRARCDEDPNLVLPDGAVRVFFNTRGTNEEEVDSELVWFLKYAERTDEQTARESGSERIWKIHEHICRIKASEEMGVKYMQKWEERIMDREEGKEEGIKEGRKEGIKEGIKEGRNRVNELTKKLAAANRLEDLVRAANEPGYQEELFEEFGL